MPSRFNKVPAAASRMGPLSTQPRSIRPFRGKVTMNSIDESGVADKYDPSAADPELEDAPPPKNWRPSQSGNLLPTDPLAIKSEG
jgi:hypothetical protein